MLCCAQLCQCVLSHPVANPHSRSIAPNRPTSAQRQQCGLDHTNPGLLQDLQFLSVFMCNRALGTVWCAFCRPPHLPKVPRDRPSVFFTFWSANRALTTVLWCPVHFLSTTLPDQAPQLRKQRPYFGDPKSHITRKKHRVSRPRVFSPVKITLSRSVTLRYIGYILITRTALAHYVVHMISHYCPWTFVRTHRCIAWCDRDLQQ